jgi:hypothetical protein
MVPLVLLTVPIYYIYRYAAGFVSVLPTSGLVSLVLKSFGLPVSAKEDKVWVDVAGQVVPFLQSIEYFDLFFVSGFFLLTLLGWWITRLISLKSAALLVVSVIIYALFRYIVLVLIYSQFDEVYGSTYPSTIIIFYDAVWRVVSFVGLPIGLLFLKYKVSSADNPTSWKHSWISAFIGSLAAGMLVAAILYSPSAGVKQGRVVIDDFYSGFWERVGDGAMENLSPENLYSYSALPTVLSDKFKVRVAHDRSLETLSVTDCDILILKTPCIPFTETEISNLHQYVAEGGGLFLIGDHSDLLGVSTNLNRVTEAWGLRFNNDSCNALSSGLFAKFTPTYAFEHPIMADVEEISFMTSCSLSVDNPHLSVVVPTVDMFSDPVDYSRPNFFGEMCPRPGQKFGVLPTCIAGNVGKGRIVVFSDGTIFSNFALFNKDNVIFFRNCLEFLNQTPPAGEAFRIIVALLSVLIIAFSVWWMGGQAGTAGRIVFASCLLVSSLATGIAVGHFQPAEEALTPEFESRSVGWISSFGDVNFPPMIGLPPALYKDASSYNSIFFSTLKQSRFPRPIAPGRALREGIDDFVVPDFSSESVVRGGKWLEKLANLGGKRAVVLISDKNAYSALKDLLSQSHNAALRPDKVIGSAIFSEFDFKQNSKILLAFTPNNLSDRQFGNPMAATIPREDLFEQTSFIWAFLGPK